MKPKYSELSDEEAINAVLQRDASYDGKFYFAVVTTGVYCRPSCTSRQPRVENLRFFDSGDLAEQAGYRACKRCKPDSVLSRHQDIVEVARYIEAHSDERLTLNTLATRFDLSETYLQKSFKAAIGLSPKAFHNGIRQQRFKSLLKSGQSVTDAVFEAGYGSVSRVYESSDSKLGMTPAAYQAGAMQEHISYVCRETALGFLMLAATDKAVCFAMFDNNKKTLLKALQREFPKANLEPAGTSNSSQIQKWYSAINRYLQSGGPEPSIPLDLRGTAFQIKVWRFLQTTAAGNTLSYGELAEMLGQPTATRAVATACGKNRIALLIPCHRILRADGSMGGYRWGLDRKQDLLEREQTRARNKIRCNNSAKKKGGI